MLYCQSGSFTGMSRETHLPTLFQLFRQHGYDGVSLAKIAAATELGKASLYHHFPGGKAEMMAAIASGQALFERGRYKKAIAEFKTALAISNPMGPPPMTIR